MDKLFLVQTTTANKCEIIGGNFLIKANNEDEARAKIEPTLCVDNYHKEFILYVFDVTGLEFKNDIYKINEFIIE